MASSEPQLRGLLGPKQAPPLLIISRCSEKRNSAPTGPSVTTIACPLLSSGKMLYSGLVRAEKPAQFFMYHGGVAVSSAACTLGVAERAPGIKRGTGTADARIVCACIARVARCS